MLRVIFSYIILLTSLNHVSGNCDAQAWFDCGNGKCISDIWLCDGDNDCHNFKDEENCDTPITKCLSSEFECISDKHCIPERWFCDGEKDCSDESDEKDCGNSTLDISEECGFRCPDNHCVPVKWVCDGNIDCSDGADEANCSSAKQCPVDLFPCTSGSCVNQSVVCDGKKDCSDGSDEGSHCGDPCENITCSQNCEKTPSGPQCYCNDGYTLNKTDNRTCLDIDECQEDGFCSQKCMNLQGGYKCSCLFGYQLRNRTCKAIGEDPILIFSLMSEIRGMRLRTGAYFSIRKTKNSAVGVDADPLTGRVYWVEFSNKSTMFSSKMDGTGMQTVLSHGLMVPEDIAIDYVASNIYLTDSGLQQVLACKMDGKMCAVLHKNVSRPRSIVLDPAEGYMYWSSWSEASPGIYRSSMDGTRRMAFVNKDVAWPNGIAIDHTLNRLYWADAKKYTIEYIALDRSFRKVLLSGKIFHPYSLAVFEDSVYWTDWYTFSLESCNKFTGHKVTVMEREHKEHLMGVHVYHSVLAARVSNPCWSNYCSHMCLLSQSHSFRCVCPTGFSLSTDQKTCSLDEEFPSLFISEGSSVYYIRPESVGNETVSELQLKLQSAIITKVAYDSNNKILFIADVNAPAIHAVNMTNQHVWLFVKEHLTSPEDLVLDWNANLYWVDSSKGTVEVISVHQRRRATLIRNLIAPVAIAVSRLGYMFVATLGTSSIRMFDMDGKNPMLLTSTVTPPMSLAVHPTKDLLYWSEPRGKTISFLNITNVSTRRVIASNLDGVMSVAVSEDYVYWTAEKRELHYMRENVTYVLQLPGQDQGISTRKVAYSLGLSTKYTSFCSVSNGGCGYLCLASPKGRTCVCPFGRVLASDNKTCVDGVCSSRDFKCVHSGHCLPGNFRCDRNKDCEDGSDEIGCGNYCSGDDFKCNKSGRCIIKSWRCDGRDDCGDNSDEQDCPETSGCTNDQMMCKDGMCIPTLWRCDGETDCNDGTDELNCHSTECKPDSQIRCGNGQCVPVSWVCDGSNDCFDGSDERNCSALLRACMKHQFRCESDGYCMDNSAKCDGRRDCHDGSDEKNCPDTVHECKKGMFHCDDGHCIYDYEICDGHIDCNNSKDEENCTSIYCQPIEIICKVPKPRCMLRRYICDGDEDCEDGSDEEGCDKGRIAFPSTTSTPLEMSCDGFFCFSTRTCLPWKRVCDGHLDCTSLPDEGGACKRSCNSTSCSDICQKTPQGSKCSCYPGYKLLPDKRTCDDIDECLDPGTCSHFCNNTKGGFKCSCADGYIIRSDHRTCKADGGPAKLVYLLGDQIRGLDLAYHSTQVYISIENADMKGMDYDASEGSFFYTAGSDGSINTYSPQTNRQDIIVKLPNRPSFIKYDWIVGNLYYVNDAGNIGVCSKNGKICSTILESGVTSIESLDISPTTRQMFWTVWEKNVMKGLYGLIERANMDSSHRLAIITHRTIYPSSITVDEIHKYIYWVDMKLSTLECSDFQGFHRRQISEKFMKYPYSMSVFEDFVYYSDWRSERLMRCNKFKDEDCRVVHEGDIKAEVIMIAHKVLQPKGKNMCLNNTCSQLCLPTPESFTCKCSDEFILKNGTCETPPTLFPPLTTQDPNKCREMECLADGECTVIEPGKFSCKCKDGYSGKHCEIQAAPLKSKVFDYTWIVAVLFAVAMIGVIYLVITSFKRNREKIHRVSEHVSIKFRNRMSEDRQLVVDTDDGGACEDQEELEREYRHSPFGGGSYKLAGPHDGSYKRWPSYDTQAISDSISNFFGRLKRKDSPNICK